MSAPSSAVDRRQVRQIASITLAAAAVFALLRWLPTGTNLNHMDFRVTAKNPIDFCDPLNPQFIPVVAVASPVTMTLRAAGTPSAGGETRFTATLKTSTGKSIAPVDLVLAHTKRLHLLIVDPTLTDYQHVHPEPAERAGDWSFTFTPRRSGVYRVFADFTPAATARGLYASADVDVLAGQNGASATEVVPAERAGPSFAPFEREGYRFSLVPGAATIRAGVPADLRFTIERAGGGVVPLEPIMGAFAHLVAFDDARSGFAHLHPMETDLAQRPDAERPTLNFKITIPRAGRYVIWAQVNLGGRETFAPFQVAVAP